MAVYIKSARSDSSRCEGVEHNLTETSNRRKTRMWRLRAAATVLLLLCAAVLTEEAAVESDIIPVQLAKDFEFRMYSCQFVILAALYTY